LLLLQLFFGLSVLSSGFIATEEAKGTTVSGYKMASSTLYIEGGVYAHLRLVVARHWTRSGLSAGIPDTGQAQDLSKMMIVYTHSKDSNTFREYTYGPNATATTFGVEGGPVMMPGDKRVFTLAEVNGPIPGGWFTIEVKPQMGAPTFVTYHLPDSFAGGSVLT
jgi:archaellin